MEERHGWSHDAEEEKPDTHSLYDTEDNLDTHSFHGVSSDDGDEHGSEGSVSSLSTATSAPRVGYWQASHIRRKQAKEHTWKILQANLTSWINGLPLVADFPDFDGYTFQELCRDGEAFTKAQVAADFAGLQLQGAPPLRTPKMGLSGGIAIGTPKTRAIFEISAMRDFPDKSRH